MTGSGLNPSSARTSSGVRTPASIAIFKDCHRWRAHQTLFEFHQRRFLTAGVRLATGGAAVQVAAAYLGASGIAISADGTAKRGEEGFLLSQADTGVPRSAALQGALRDLNPDAIGSRATGCLGELPAAFSGPGPWIAIGGSPKQAALVYRSEQGCEACFGESATALGGPPEGVSSVLLGTLSALVYQRLCLTLSSNLGGLWINSAGRVSTMELRRCPRCI